MGILDISSTCIDLSVKTNRYQSTKRQKNGLGLKSGLTEQHNYLSLEFLSD